MIYKHPHIQLVRRFSRNARSRMMPTRRGTANLSGSGRDSWPPWHATLAASSVNFLYRGDRKERMRGREGGRKRGVFEPRGCGNDYFSDASLFLSVAMSFENTIVIYACIASVRDLCSTFA